MKRIALLLLLLGASATYLYKALLPEKAAPTVEVSPTWSAFDEVSHLQMIIQGFSIKTMVDVPAVDPEALSRIDLGLEKYIGISHDLDLSRALQAQYGSARRTFQNARVDVDPLPQTDLILFWEPFSNFTEQEVRAALFQFKRSGSKFLMMRHAPNVEENGGTGPINWRLPPYNLPEPIITINEKKGVGLALWTLASL